MKNKFNKVEFKKKLGRVLAFLLMIALCLGMLLPAIVYAAPVAEETVEAVDAAEEVVEKKVINAYETQDNHDESDHCISFVAKCPDGFKASVVVELTQDSNGQKYEVFLDSINGYFGKIFLPANEHYTVDKVYCENITAFTFIMDTTGITTTVQGNTQIKYTMENLDDIVQNEYGQFVFKTGEATGMSAANGTGDELYSTPIDFIKMARDGRLFYDVTYEGQSHVSLDVIGYAKRDYDFVIKVVKGGIINEAQYKISTDGGATYNEHLFTATNGEDVGDTGLTFAFSALTDTDELLKDDEYRCKAIQTHAVESSADPEDALLLATGSPSHSTYYKVKVMSSGGLGVSKIGLYEGEEDTTPEIMLLPKEGALELKDDVKLLFKDDANYKKDMEFDIIIALGEVEAIDYTALYIMGGVLFGIILMVYIVLMSKRDKKTDYVIRRYKSFQDEDKYGM